MKLTYPPESKPLEGYTIKRAIARGGFGEVYYAVSDAGKEVALKLLRQNLEVELRGVSQCLNLNHPNLVLIYDIRTDSQGDHWIIMEYVAGNTLDQVLDDAGGPLPLRDVRHWLSEITSGLTYLHSRGLVHRDLKPANIFESGGTIKIGDVGLSKFISESQAHAQTQSVGTVHYMAPEVAHGRYGKTVDVYALGVILWEMITGEVPFDGESQAEILMKHLTEPPDLNKLPPRLRPILARALEKDPSRRYQSAAELERNFERAVKDMEHGITDLADTVYPAGSSQGKRPVAPPPPPPIHERYAASYDRDRYSRYAGAGERSGGLGAGKWILVAVVVMALFPRLIFGHGFSRLVVLGGLVTALLYALSRLRNYALGTPAYPLPRIDRRPPPPPRPTREELRYVAQQRRQERMAALEERKAAIRAARNARRFQYATRQKRRGYANVSPSAQRNLSLRQRASEMSTSLTFASLTTALLTAGLVLMTSFLADTRLALFGAVTLIGSSVILGTAKLLEGRGQGWGNKRLAFLAAGALVGAAAWFVTTNLFITFQQTIDGDMARGETAFGPVSSHIVLTDTAGQPTIAGFALFFAGLFFLRRWAWHADSFRDKRFRLRSVLLTTGIGFIWALVVGFPVMWGVTWAAALSSVVQLSACWVPPEERHRMMETQNNV